MATQTAAMQTGNRLEGALIEFAQEELAAPIKRNQYRVSHGSDGGVLAANLDGIVLGKAEGVECKYVGQSMAEEWGEPGTDEVPDHVIIQVQHAMYCADLDKMWVAAAVAGYSLDWRLYCVPRSEKLIALIVEREMSFWVAHVLAGIPPTPGPPPLEVMAALTREPGSLTLLDDEYLEALSTYEQWTTARRDADQIAEKAKRELLALLDEAEAGKFADGTLITYLSQKSPPHCDLKRLRAELPEVYDGYVTQGTHRVLRIKRPKERRVDESQDSLSAPTEPARITDARENGPDGSAQQPARAGGASGDDGGEAVPTG